jgi:hypothetical protein
MHAPSHSPALRHPITPAWCPDEETRHNVVARRNVLAGLWAGGLIGLSGDALTAYAADVHFADFEACGDGDVIAKLTADLHQAGLPIRPSVMRERINALHRQALLQTHVTD